MRQLFIITLVSISTLCFGQKESHGLYSISRKFEVYYNQSNYDSIFNMFSAEMKQSMPIDSTLTFFTGLKKKAGNIIGREFRGYEQGYAVYRMIFERGTFLINIAAGYNSQIIGLIVKPSVK